MKKLISLFGILSIVISSFAQTIEKEAPKGFDKERTGINKGKLDSIIYESKTVGNSRKALIYTPPGFDKNKK